MIIFTVPVQESCLISIKYLPRGSTVRSNRFLAATPLSTSDESK